MTETIDLADFKELMTTGGLPDLGPGPRAGAIPFSTLAKMLDALLNGAALPAGSKRLIRALILLWHDHMDASHEISQAIENADGSFVHGILHRREPDYGNAGYWFCRVGRHECFPEIATRAGEFLKARNETLLTKELTPNGTWDAFAFIDACEQVSGKSATDPQGLLLREIQGIESFVLLEHFLKA